MPPDPKDDTSTLEALRRKLYSPETPEVPSVAELPRAAAPASVAPAWEPPPAVPVRPPKKPIPWPVVFLCGAALFFMVAMAAAAWFLFMGGRSVSTDRIAIAPDGPIAAASGDTVTILVPIENRNPVPVLNTLLTVDLPETARSPEDPALAALDFQDTVGDIPAGGRGDRTVRAVLFGSEGETVRVPIRFEYRVEGSNATFVKEAVYEVLISSSPLSVRATTAGEAQAGGPVSFTVTVRSDAPAPLDGVAVLAEPPFGFRFAAGTGPLFPIGTLQPGEERTVTVSGTLSGEDADERFFRFSVGTARPADNALSVVYGTTQVPVRLARPFLQPSLSVDRDASAAPVVAAGASVQGVVSWANTLTDPIFDGRVTVRLSGNALAPGTISSYTGFYRSSDGTITFSRERDSTLARLDPGASGSGGFAFGIRPQSALAGVTNPEVTATVSVAGRRVGETGVPETIENALVRTVRVGTELALGADSVHSTGPFDNTGPWPPRADAETTFTVRLSLESSVNALADGTVTGTLPSYVRYTGVTSPSDGSISYDDRTRTVTWKAGEVAARAREEAAFQVALLPSASQRGSSPVLFSGIVASGVDRWTKLRLEEAAPAVTTDAKNDPTYVDGSGEVR